MNGAVSTKSAENIPRYNAFAAQNDLRIVPASSGNAYPEHAVQPSRLQKKDEYFPNRRCASKRKRCSLQLPAEDPVHSCVINKKRTHEKKTTHQALRATMAVAQMFVRRVMK